MQDDARRLDLDNQFCFTLYVAYKSVGRAYAAALKPLDLTYSSVCRVRLWP